MEMSNHGSNYKGTLPHRFDPEDLSYVEPLKGTEAICRCCFGYSSLAESG